MAGKVGNITLEGARIVFRNFAGKADMYNQEGNRNFSVVLPRDLADQMVEDGWNVKQFKPGEDGEPGDPYIQVTVKYRARDGREVRPPQVTLITSKGRNNIGEDEIEVLDWADIETADMIIRPFEWGPIQGKYGVSAYLQKLFVTIREDELDRKYSDLEQLPSRSGRVEE